MTPPAFPHRKPRRGFWRVAGCLAALWSAQACGQQSVDMTETAGWVAVPCPGNSDTAVALPFAQPSVLEGVVASVAGNALTLNNNPGMTPGEFTNCLLRVGPTAGLSGRGPLEGRWYVITGNDASSLTLDLNGDSLASLAAGTQVSVSPCWTLDTLFPASQAGVTYTSSTGTQSLRTQILIPNYSGNGTNLSLSGTYYYLNGAWRAVGDSSTADHGSDSLIPDGYIIVRNANGAPALPVVFHGAVSTDRLASSLAVNADSAQDNPVGLARPADVTLNNLGLSGTDNSFRATGSTHALQDQLLVYNNCQAGFNKAPSAAYYYISAGGNVGWRLAGDANTTDHGGDIIPAASALVVRKAAGGTAATVYWNNEPNY